MGRSLAQQKIAKVFYWLGKRAPIPDIVKARIPSSLKSRYWKASSALGPASRYQSFQSMNIEAMDEELLGVFIRSKAHILNKVSKTRWTKNKADTYAVDKQRLIAAIEDWHVRSLEISDDITWAKEIIQRYSEWEESKAPVKLSVAPPKAGGFYNTIRHRRSIRYFESREIEDDKIMTILDSARWAPCSGNLQAWKLVVQKRLKGQYIAIPELDFNKEKWRQGAAVIYVAIDERLYPEKYTAAMDAAVAIQNMLLTAHHLGLGGGWWVYLAENAHQEKLRHKLGLEDYHYVYSAILLGYPAESPEAPGRKPLEKIVRFIGF